MIISFLLSLVYGIVWLLTRPLTLFADVSMPIGIVTAYQNIQGYISDIAVVFPVADLIIALGILITVEGAFKLLESFGFVIRKIPGGMS